MNSQSELLNCKLLGWVVGHGTLRPDAAGMSTKLLANSRRSTTNKLELQRSELAMALQSETNALSLVSPPTKADLGVLHTWGQAVEHHPHVNYIVPAGGLSADASPWRTESVYRARKKVQTAA